MTRSSGLVPCLTFIKPVCFYRGLATKGFLFVILGLGSSKGWRLVGVCSQWRPEEEGEGRFGSLLPPCCLLHCTAAVSAGMAPLTICSLIANIRVHFLGHWSGTERWWAELWAFLSLFFFFFAFLRSALSVADVRTHKHVHTKFDRRPLSHPSYLDRLQASNCPSVSEQTDPQ